jgi:A/G-specific adenine glycosylase
LPKTISEKLIDWYHTRKRSLPWREKAEAYGVWVAEIMAQQTRLESMLPYYDRWMKRFPDLRAVAEADEQELLSIWEGLGYYQRARNLQKAAQIIVSDYGGEILKR